MSDPIEQEEAFALQHFDLPEIIEIQRKHSLQVIRGADWQYMLYVDGEAYGPALTFLGALVEGLEQFKMSQARQSEK